MTDAAVAASGAQGDLASPNAQGAESQEAKVYPEKVRVKIDGGELEVPFDEITRDYQKYKGSEKRFQEASNLRKQAQEDRKLVETFIGKAKAGDLSWLRGIVPEAQIKQWAESQLLEHIEWEQLPESEKRARIAERRLEEYEEEKARDRESQREKELEALTSRASQDLERELIDAVKELGHDFKVTPRFVRRIAEDIVASMEALDPEDPQAKPRTAKEAKDRAYNGLVQDATELLSILPEDKVIAMLPPKIREAIRRKDVEAATTQVSSRMKGLDTDQSAPSPRSKFQRMSIDQKFNQIEKKYGKG